MVATEGLVCCDPPIADCGAQPDYDGNQNLHTHAHGRQRGGDLLGEGDRVPWLGLTIHIAATRSPASPARRARNFTKAGAGSFPVVVTACRLVASVSAGTKSRSPGRVVRDLSR